MGLYDRDYERQRPYGSQPGFNIQAPTTVTVKIIIVTAAVYLVQVLSSGWLTNYLQLYDSWYREPWQAYRLLTYGFAHSDSDMWHILLNMFSLWLFGREVEYRYGSREFLAFYLVAIVVAGLVWTLSELPFSQGVPSSMVGASGGVVAVLVLFAFNFPHREVLFMMLFPMPMWMLAMIVVVMDAAGAVHRSGNVAFTAHLGGAAFAFLYYQMGWHLAKLLPGPGMWKRLKPKPKLRVVDADDSDADADADKARLDAILKKISEKGEDSLTYGERRFLQRTSKEYQDRLRH